MNSKLFRVVSPSEWGLIIDARLEKMAQKRNQAHKEIEIDFEAKEHQGAYADDEVEEPEFPCIVCGYYNDHHPDCTWKGGAHG